MGMQSRCFNFELDVLWARYLKIDGEKKGKPAGLSAVLNSEREA
jgi:hypothetical protein